MKKLRFILFFVIVVTLSALMLVSCGEKLNAPSGVIEDVETQSLKWNHVKGAKYYTIVISGQDKEITTKNPSVSLEKLEAGVYEVKIKANSDGKALKDSDWTIHEFKRPEESGLKYELINNDTEYQLVGGGTAEGDVVMESTFRNKPVTAIAEKALYNNHKITGIKIGDNVKTIGSKAFAKCSKLTSVTVPEGVTSIGEYAFQSCKSLTDIELPNSVTVITPHMFEWCSALTNVKLGNSVTTINEYAFANCDALASITYAGAPENDEFKACMPDTLKYIATYAFTDCVGLTTVDLGAGVETIASLAFVNCKSLTKIDLGTSLLNLEEGAFYNCQALNDLVVPDSTEKIGNNVFFECKSLSKVSLGKGLKSIGYYAFYGTAIMEAAEKTLIIDGWLLQVIDTEIENLLITEGVYGIASYATNGCTKLVQIDIKGVKYVGEHAFRNCQSLYKATFDSSLEEIGSYAFYNCPYLKTVTLGENTRVIGDYSFYGCTSLSEMVFPDTVTSVGTYAFRKTAAYTKVEKSAAKGVVYMGGWAVDYVTDPNSIAFRFAIIEENTKGIAKYTFNAQMILGVVIPDTVEYICKGAFYKCPAMRINIPKSLKYVGDYAFYGCASTSFGDDTYSLVLPEGTEYVGRSAFYGCKNILSVTIPSTVESIGDYAFYGCSAIGATVELTLNSGEVDDEGKPIYKPQMVTGTVSIAEGVKSIGQRAFQGCASLTKIVLPNSVTELGSRAFYKCPALKSVTLGSGINEIKDYTFYKCEALETVVVSDELENIGNYAFRGCIALKEFDLKKVVTLGRYSFYGCSALTRIVLPDTLTTIGDYAFRGCTSVVSVVIPDSVTNIGRHVFYGLNTTTLYCQSEGIMPYWNSQFNSSYRPVFWKCTLSEDNKYVVSVTVIDKVTLVNSQAKNGISDPCRSGYTFGGWSTELGGTTAAYTSQNIKDAEIGTVLYAIWLPEQPVT